MAAIYLAFVGVPCLPAGARAQVWTLSSVGEAATEHAPNVRRAQAQLRTARAYRAYERTPIVGNPTVNLRALIGKPDDPAATYSAFVGLPIQLGGRRRAWHAETRHRVAEAESLLRATQNEARSSARSAFVDAALATMSLTISTESASTADELLAKVRAQLDQGAATALDASLAEAQAAQGHADVAQARRRLVDAEARLRAVLNLRAQDPIALAELPPPSLPTLSESRSALNLRNLQPRSAARTLAHQPAAVPSGGGVSARE